MIVAVTLFLVGLLQGHLVPCVFAGRASFGHESRSRLDDAVQTIDQIYSTLNGQEFTYHEHVHRTCPHEECPIAVPNYLFVDYGRHISKYSPFFDRNALRSIEVFNQQILENLEKPTSELEPDTKMMKRLFSKLGLLRRKENVEPPSAAFANGHHHLSFTVWKYLESFVYLVAYRESQLLKRLGVVQDDSGDEVPCSRRSSYSSSGSSAGFLSSSGTHNYAKYAQRHGIDVDQLVFKDLCFIDQDLQRKIAAHIAQVFSDEGFEDYQTTTNEEEAQLNRFYLLPPIGADLLLRFHIIKAAAFEYLEDETQRQRLASDSDESSWFFSSIVHIIFGSLPMIERLDRIRFIYQRWHRIPTGDRYRLGPTLINSYMVGLSFPFGSAAPFMRLNGGKKKRFLVFRYDPTDINRKAKIVEHAVAFDDLKWSNEKYRDELNRVKQPVPSLSQILRRPATFPETLAALKAYQPSTLKTYLNTARTTLVTPHVATAVGVYLLGMLSVQLVPSLSSFEVSNALQWMDTHSHPLAFTLLTTLLVTFLAVLYRLESGTM